MPKLTQGYVENISFFADCCKGMPSRITTSLITSARILVAVGRGTRSRQLTRNTVTCSKVTFAGAVFG